MSMKIVHVLCEGQTEQGFVGEVLSPYLLQRGIAVKAILLSTNRKKNAYGGMLSYAQVQKDLAILQRSLSDGQYERHIITTMFDYYALPTDFPGYAKSQDFQDPYQRIAHLEQSFGAQVADDRFVSYIQLHEFEALLFCNVEYLKDKYPESSKKIDGLKKALDETGNPELINRKPETAPSKRIIKALEGNYKYNKPNSGKYVTSRIGMDNLLRLCPHFKEWVEALIEK